MPSAADAAFSLLSDADWKILKLVRLAVFNTTVSMWGMLVVVLAAAAVHPDSFSGHWLALAGFTVWAVQVNIRLTLV